MMSPLGVKKQRLSRWSEGCIAINLRCRVGSRRGWVPKGVLGLRADEAVDSLVRGNIVVGRQPREPRDPCHFMRGTSDLNRWYDMIVCRKPFELCARKLAD
jgi:hypothetical protein